MSIEKEVPLSALVVDDSMLIRHTVCRFLEDLGFSVESATNGLEALEHVKRRIPHLIITDMSMPKMTGGDLITALRSNPETAAVPVIVLAGRSSGFQEGERRANFAIFKDIDIEDQLRKGLQTVLGDKAFANSSGR
jgi:CheY-like chemotaxis protein